MLRFIWCLTGYYSTHRSKSITRHVHVQRQDQFACVRGNKVSSDIGDSQHRWRLPKSEPRLIPCSLLCAVTSILANLRELFYIKPSRSFCWSFRCLQHWKRCFSYLSDSIYAPWPLSKAQTRCRDRFEEQDGSLHPSSSERQLRQ